MDDETPVVFNCAGEQLLGVVHRGNSEATVGVVIVVGGPQYRVGSHRQFVLMARQMAAGGVPVLRFDYRGMGDSSGERRTFEEIEDDIRVAIDSLMGTLPNLKQVTLMGLCDAASAIMMYCHRDDRVAGMILLNPWTGAGAGSRKVRLRRYYFMRMLQISNWRSVLSEAVSSIKSMRSNGTSTRAAGSWSGKASSRSGEAGAQFVPKMLLGLENFEHPILLMLSGRDLANREFLKLSSTDMRWKSAMQRLQIDTRHLDDADHTLSAREDLNRATSQCLEWLKETQGL